MRPARRTFYLLLVLFGLIDLAEVGWKLLDHPPNVASTVVLAVLFVQVSLLAAWAGIGTARWSMRLTGLIVGAAVLSLVLARMQAGYRDDAVASLFLAQIIIVTGALAPGSEFPSGHATNRNSGRDERLAAQP